jgi:hypothetical protein
MNSRTRTAAMAAVLLALAGGDSTTVADEPKPVPQHSQLNSKTGTSTRLLVPGFDSSDVWALGSPRNSWRRDAFSS